MNINIKPGGVIPLETCIIGAGNPWREDDGVGPVMAGMLKALIPETIADIFCLEERLFELQTWFSFYRKIIIIDALPPGVEPGKVKAYRIKKADIILWRRMPQVTHNAYSLHDLDLLWQIQYAFLNGYKGELMLIGIEAGTMGWGEGLSPQLKRVLPIVLFKLEQKIREFLNDNSGENLLL